MVGDRGKGGEGLIKFLTVRRSVSVIAALG